MEVLSIEEKARRYDEIMAKRSEAAKKSNKSRSKSTRKASAQKAIETRWKNRKDEWLSEHNCKILIQEMEFVDDVLWLEFSDGVRMQLEKGSLPELAEKYRAWESMRDF